MLRTKVLLQNRLSHVREANYFCAVNYLLAYVTKHSYVRGMYLDNSGKAVISEELITYAEGLSLLYLEEDLPRGGGADPLFDSRLIFS